MTYRKLTLIILRSFVLLSNTWFYTQSLTVENTLLKHNFFRRHNHLHHHHHHPHTHSIHTENPTYNILPVENIDSELIRVPNISIIPTQPSPSITSAFQLIIPSNVIKSSIQQNSNLNDSEERELISGGTINNKIIKEQPSGGRDGCRGCPIQGLTDILPKYTLREMRINHIKEQILKKLNMKEPPSTFNIPIHSLPSDLIRELSVEKTHRNKKQDNDEDDFFGNTEEVIVFLEDGSSNCIVNQTEPHSCYTFRIPQEMDHKKVSSAELWIYRKGSNYLEIKQTFWVTELLPTIPTLKHNVTIREGWLKLNISSLVTKWHEIARNHSRTKSIHKFSHSIFIGCKTCIVNSPSDFPFDVQTSLNKPFVVVHIAAESSRKRSRRNINCSPGFSECCRESFNVSFAEIGWQDWIIQPTQYEAFYCKGSCVNINGITHSMAHHTSILQRYIQVHGIRNGTEELVPCCSASRLSSISLLYRNSNTTIKKELPNMVVESCGCL